MPKSKSNKKRKQKVLNYKSKLQKDKQKLKNLFMKGMQESHQKEMEEKMKSGQVESTVEGLNEFSLDNSSDNQPVIDGLSELGLGEVQQIELDGAPPDSFSGVIK